MGRALPVDAVVVLLFVAIGRETHDEGNAIVDVLATALPFLFALVLGSWLAVRRPPHTGIWAGIITWVTTVAVGMILRRLAFGEGTALTFVLVATAFLGLGMLGWRLALARFSRR